MNADTAFSRRPAPLRDPSLPARLPFTKMQGLGNDYIYVEEFGSPLADPAPLAVAISDRHFGVGGDGLVLIGDSAAADFRMRIFNADGSEAEMCGNATRCVGKYLYEKGLTDKREIRLETLAGIRVLGLEVAGDGERGAIGDGGRRDGAAGGGNRVERVRVDMGEPILRPELIPVKAEGESFIDREITVNGRKVRGTAVSMGNPHFVVRLPGLAELDLAGIGPFYEHHALFPRRINTEFVEVLERDRIRMRVWERGAGETLACGTGACAALVACALSGWTGRKAVVELRGGELEIEWAEDGRVYKTGDAAFVFSGEYRTGS